MRIPFRGALRTRSGMALFWRLFATYFVLILIPAIVASTFTYFFVVSLIENDAKQVNRTMMRTFSEQTDAVFSSLKTDMIQMLSTSTLKSFMRSADASADNQQRLELVHSLMDQLGKVNARTFVANSYLYFSKQDLIIDVNTYTSKDYYFRHYDPIDRQKEATYFANFEGKKMMAFTQAPRQLTAPDQEMIRPADANLAVLMSYPFNAPVPDVYLVVNVDRAKLKEQIAVGEKWVTETAILDSGGQIISQTGTTEKAVLAMRDPAYVDQEQFIRLPDGKRALTYKLSSFDENWSYVSVINLETLMKPAHLLRTLSLGFLLFFLAVGSLVSYWLGRRLYTPIADIRHGLAAHRRVAEGWWQTGNDFDIIKRFSNLLIVENQDLSRKVDGMTPLVQEHLLSRMLLGNTGGSSRDNGREVEDSWMSGGDGKIAYTVLCVEIQERFPGNDEMIVPEITAMLRKMAAERTEGELWLCQLKPRLLACVVPQASDSGYGPEAAAADLSQQLTPFTDRIKAALSIGKTVSSVEELHLSYEHAAALLRARTLDPVVDVCREELGEESVGAWDCFLSSGEVNRMALYHQSGDYSGLMAFVGELLGKGRERGASAYQINYLCADILHTWIRFAEAEKSGFSIPFYAGLFERLNGCVTWEELISCFHDLLSILFRPERRQDRASQFAEILTYIDTHYGEELSIDYFAEWMNLSVGHFSRTFKEEVGEKYVDYVARVRLAKAKHLLLETDMKIDDIAEKIGYWGRNSFIRLFRKHEGVTPAKYRSLHQT
ncbi:hypothetical protein J31TS4_10900 [Paenibacillus sp. J31TS4]|uniref:helix-turn-helix domain-containing protein n=1 Tax=Paenibacillus sp. J31TS4 TaxID=2807195 RepID=UPI001B1DEDB7|nr:helix-turn-helix domain-containing protein [Paenibacillus sp. J31TS4]GIP37810.1 hypothetical protein J31TS4_10900 [Paenibacillus sp. J31TS4]